MKASKEVSEEVREKVLNHIMVRRTRREIMKYYKKDLQQQKLTFPKLNTPKKIIYIFDNELDKVFNETLDVIKTLTYSRYKALTYLKNIKDQNDKSINPVILKKLVVNGNDITDEFKNSLTSGTNEGDLKSTYPNSYSLDKNNNNFKKYMTFKDSIYVDMEYSTLVDMTDLMYSHQIDKACKHYCMHFNVKPNEFDITVLGFGFMSLGNTKRQRCVETNNGYMLRFLDWILPGDGVCVMLNSKN